MFNENIVGNPNFDMYFLIKIYPNETNTCMIMKLIQSFIPKKK